MPLFLLIGIVHMQRLQDLCMWRQIEVEEKPNDFRRRRDSIPGAENRCLSRSTRPRSPRPRAQNDYFSVRYLLLLPAFLVFIQSSSSGLQFPSNLKLSGALISTRLEANVNIPTLRKSRVVNTIIHQKFLNKFTGSSSSSRSLSRKSIKQPLFPCFSPSGMED
ncbi:hypothetical protein KSP40_PGU007069 [Platanthera guangdongensis]|uniref:Uncharacterized protein n=1 Tax=Platanthera guangdongensis TaxID=2320717 RepID=A0ABR2MBY4_9ASPA